jgi:hypothetical protein
MAAAALGLEHNTKTTPTSKQFVPFHHSPIRRSHVWFQCPFCRRRLTGVKIVLVWIPTRSNSSTALQPYSNQYTIFTTQPSSVENANLMKSESTTHKHVLDACVKRGYDVVCLGHCISMIIALLGDSIGSLALSEDLPVQYGVSHQKVRGH